MKKSELLYTTSVIGLVSAYFNLPETLQNQMPDDFGYIWAKCSLMVNMGFERYSVEDHFGYPLKDFITKDYIQAINQILNDLNGFSSDNPITINDTITMHYIAYSLHFKINLITDYYDGLIKVDAKHFIENDEITLYFIQKKL